MHGHAVADGGAAGGRFAAGVGVGPSAEDGDVPPPVGGEVLGEFGEQLAGGLRVGPVGPVEEQHAGPAFGGRGDRAGRAGVDPKSCGAGHAGGLASPRRRREPGGPGVPEPGAQAPAVRCSAVSLSTNPKRQSFLHQPRRPKSGAATALLQQGGTNRPAVSTDRRSFHRKPLPGRRLRPLMQKARQRGRPAQPGAGPSSPTAAPRPSLTLRVGDAGVPRHPRRTAGACAPGSDPLITQEARPASAGRASEERADRDGRGGAVVAADPLVGAPVYTGRRPGQTVRGGIGRIRPRTAADGAISSRPWRRRSRRGRRGGRRCRSAGRSRPASRGPRTRGRRRCASRSARSPRR